MSWRTIFSIGCGTTAAGGWTIDDIVNRAEGKDYPVREALSQPYECGPFMKKPCKR